MPAPTKATATARREHREKTSPRAAPRMANAARSMRIIRSNLEDIPLEGVLDLLREMGVYDSLIDKVDQAVEEGLTHAAAPAGAGRSRRSAALPAGPPGCR